MMLLLLLLFLSLCNNNAWLNTSVHLLKSIDQDPNSLSVPDVEYWALQDLYNATQGDYWYWVPSAGAVWNFSGSSDPCIDQWQGVSCIYDTHQNVSHVVGIQLIAYNLVGTLPSSISQLTNLSNLELYFNTLTGTIPASVGTLASLTNLDLSFNALWGVLPNSLYDLANLETLYVNSNEVSGTLSDALGSLTYLTTLDLSDNYLWGLLPNSFGSLINLEVLYLNSNFLSGEVPDVFDDLGGLENLNLGSNNLWGSPPESLGALVNLLELTINHNVLNGTLPESLGRLRHLQLVDFYVNRLQGTIPPSYALLASLDYVDLYSNLLTGKVPAFTSVNLETLYLGDNKLTGPIPSSLGHLPLLNTLYMNQNQLTGTVPTSLSQLEHLTYLYLEQNMLDGNLDGVFNSTVQHNLNVVLFSDNRFTGNLPSELFRISSLTAVDGGFNCMGGTLPRTLCKAVNLDTLALDGLHASTHCRSLLLKGISKSYRLADPITGGVPACLFELPHLATLHMSFNGITGTLPRDITLHRTFIDFSLSHNFITGTIPHRFQQRSWKNLDLSFNRLEGTLGDGFAPQTVNNSLDLRNNRLSGPLPQTIIDAINVSVLTSNLFSCNGAQTDLPHNDEKASTYQCGSNTFNVSYYFWLSATAVLFACGLWYALRLKGGEVSVSTALYDAYQQVRSILSVLELTDGQGTSYKAHLRRFKKICDICKLILRLSCLLTAFAAFVLLPFYAIMSKYYSTHTHKYAYFVSIIFLTGEVPLALCLVFLTIFALFAFACFVVFLRAYQRECVLFEADINQSLSDRGMSMSERSYRESSSAVENVLTWEKISIYVGCVLVDVIVVVSANVGFVLAVLNEDKSDLVVAQVALSFFKLFWGAVCSWTAYYLSVIMEFESKNIKRGIFSMLFIITLFNNIVAPCLVVMAISPTCFLNVFKPEAGVSGYTYKFCLSFDNGTCEEYVGAGAVSATDFEPPFIYSYQCAASFLTSYAPSFVYLCIVSGFVIPAVRWASHQLLRKATKGTRWYKVLRFLTPAILRPISTSKSIPRKLFSPYFDSRNLLVTILNYLGILMTFGAVFPPLAVAMCVTIVSHVFFSRMEAKKFLEEAARKNPEYIDVVDEDCYGVGSDTMLLRATWVLITLAFWFYTLFLFDMLGDAVDFTKAYWVLLVVPALPLLLYVSFKGYTGTFFLRTRVRLFTASSSSSLSVSNVTSVELIARIQEEAMSPMSNMEAQPGCTL